MFKRVRGRSGGGGGRAPVSWDTPIPSHVVCVTTISEADWHRCEKGWDRVQIFALEKGFGLEPGAAWDRFLARVQEQKPKWILSRGWSSADIAGIDKVMETAWGLLEMQGVNRSSVEPTKPFGLAPQDPLIWEGEPPSDCGVAVFVFFVPSA